ncbi:malto-oligosyltrehalose synthase [Methylocaldum sp.]|uniref:malto-oligosyltrehalose synthase n=1 Tax=Methylocaldum sp. TaxID=1969727 RepID=UPI002D49BEDC|nr:malto-oligosyltrehalose synthase [Methylocaldum sp.]HYE35172.1 malto-oligosyltrehalose synthase [Methylocaldum sp.]
MPVVKAIDQLCSLCGIETEFVDARGETVRISTDTKRELLAAMGIDACDEAHLPSIMNELEHGDWLRILPPVKVVGADEDSRVIACTVPRQLDHVLMTWSLELDDGARWDGDFCPAERPLIGELKIQGQSYRRFAFTLPAQLPLGYHRLTVEYAEKNLKGAMSFIVTPERCYLPPVLQEKRKIWGLSLSLYAVRSQRNWGIGDFTDLKSLVDYAVEHEAAMIRVNPLHALKVLKPEVCNGYEPSSRAFYNVLYLDVEAIPDFAESETVQQTVADPEFQAHLRALRAEELIDCPEVAAVKLGILESLFAHFRDKHLQKPTERGKAFRAYQSARGPALYYQSLFDALCERFSRKDAGYSAWTDWPPEFRDPSSPEVQSFAAENAARLDYYAYLYWQAEQQMQSAGDRAAELGLSIGLCQEFVFNAAADGAEVWSQQALCASGVRLGSPPTEARPDGELSTVSPFMPSALREAAYRPFIAGLRQNMRHTGALLVHNVTDLIRQYWVPAGGSPEDGSYVAFPFEDLLGILALESHRNRCLVLATDDETLPAEIIGPLERAGVVPCESLFSYWKNERPLSAREYPPESAITTAEIDEPPLRGFWLGRDLDERKALKLFASEDSRHEAIVARAVARVRLLVALEREGLLPPDINIHPISVPDMTPELVRAVYLLLSRTPAEIVLLRLEDALGQADQLVLPGAPPDFPDRRRKLPLEFEQWRKEDTVTALLQALAESRSAIPKTHPKGKPAAATGIRFSIPRATYRLQFNRNFTFRQATDILSYLQDLGISHCYASPYLKARPGSTHGYDIVDHGELNPEIGSRDDFEHFVAELSRRGMGQILDLVPNHMGVMGSDNIWWLDVLENGAASDYADFFDIDWSPVKDYLRGKVLLPTLGLPYGTALESGELQLTFDAKEGSFSVYYGPHRFPIDPREYPHILGYRLDQLKTAVSPDDPQLAEFQSLITAFGHLPGRWQTGKDKRSERNRDKEIHKQHLARLCAASQDVSQFIAKNVSEFNGTPGVPASFDRLHELLEAQAYRLAYWRVAADEINYRRFFDTNDLAALSIENDAVFEATHRFILDLIAQGKLQGLRIDHPDGLYDPEAYCRTLQDRVLALTRSEPAESESQPAAGSDGQAFYIVVEKILALNEHLPSQWPTHGTTGYDFANVVNGLFIWPDAEQLLDAFYRSFCAFPVDFDELLYQSKRLILKVALSSELTVLANRLSRIAENDRRTRDYSLNSLRDALREIIACFPVYRTYVTGRSVSETDRNYIELAVDQAKKRSLVGDLTIFDFVRDELLILQAEGKSDRYREQVVSFAMKFQQLTGPAMAKGMEDTAFYRYNRFVSLNEVGGDPRHFGVSLADFHRRNEERSRSWPHALLSTSTHDTKRSEDVRARINVLSEIPDEWIARVRHWSELNREKKSIVDGAPAPSRNDEYLIYQTLIGTWPLGALNREGLGDYTQRLEAYMVKAMREAKLFSSWLNPNLAYEQAVSDFLLQLTTPADQDEFVRDFFDFQSSIARAGLHNSLAQLLLKLTVPGVPDLYQGNELWDFSLVDPDNRRPVDYQLRQALLENIKAWDGLSAPELAPRLGEMQDEPADGRIKLYVTRETLRLRQQDPDLFRRGGYHPLAAEGKKAEHLCAFLRRFGSRTVLVAVPRWIRRLGNDAVSAPLDDRRIWDDTRLLLPPAVAGTYLHCFTREHLTLNGTGPLMAAELFSGFPLALLIKVD